MLLPPLALKLTLVSLRHEHLAAASAELGVIVRVRVAGRSRTHSHDLGWRDLRMIELWESGSEWE